MVPRAATDEKLRDGAMRGVVAFVPARCPADHLELVVVTLADDVAARVREPPHDVQVTARRGPMHRVGVVSLLARVHVQAALQQQVHRRKVSLPRACNSVHSYGFARTCSLSGCLSSSAARVSTSPFRAASNSWPSTVNESMCALSARQLEKP